MHTRPSTSAATTSDGRPRVPPIDGLRGLAILAVFLFHTDHLPGGFLGVDLFFTLSGYLITGQLLRESARTGGISLTSFWGRRFRRLVPASTVVLTTVALWARVTGPSAASGAIGSDGPWAQFGLLNWHLLAESASYWNRFGPGRPLEHLWSIAVEEQFYVLWPVVMLLVVSDRGTRPGRPGNRVLLAAVCLALAAASAAVVVLLGSGPDPTRVYIGTDTRAYSLLIGAAAACVPDGVAGRRAGRPVGVVSALLLIGLLLPWGVLDGTSTPWLHPGGLLVYGVGVAALLVCCEQDPTTPVARLLANPALRWLGSISYGLYLWHWPIIVLAPDPLTGWWRTVVVTAVSLAAAVASRHLVEDPLRSGSRWGRGRRGLVALATAMVWLSMLWLLVPDPAPSRVDVELLN